MLADHELHLVRHAGHRVHDLVADRRLDPRRGPDRVRDRLGADRHVALPQVVLGHRPAARREQRGHPLDELLTPLELDAHHVGDRLAGHVVGGRAQPTTHDHGVAPVEQLAQGLHHPLEVVAYLPVLEAVDSRVGELLTDPRAVGVDDLAEEELGPDRQHLASHARLSCHPRRSMSSADSSVRATATHSTVCRSQGMSSNGGKRKAPTAANCKVVFHLPS